MDAELFTKMVKNYEKTIRNYAHSLTHNRALADDIVQDMWMSLWRQNTEVDINRAFGLLSLAVRRRYVDYCRTKDLKLKFLGSYSDPYRTHDHTDDTVGVLKGVQDRPIIDIETYSVSLKKTLAQLSPKIRKSVEAVVIKGFTHQETADKFGISINTVLSRVRRGKEQLRRIK